jgi:hypothetical protein
MEDRKTSGRVRKVAEKHDPVGARRYHKMSKRFAGRMHSRCRVVHVSVRSLLLVAPSLDRRQVRLRRTIDGL